MFSAIKITLFRNVQNVLPFHFADNFVGTVSFSYAAWQYLSNRTLSRPSHLTNFGQFAFFTCWFLNCVSIYIDVKYRSSSFYEQNRVPLFLRVHILNFSLSKLTVQNLPSYFVETTAVRFKSPSRHPYLHVATRVLVSLGEVIFAVLFSLFKSDMAATSRWSNSSSLTWKHISAGLSTSYDVWRLLSTSRALRCCFLTLRDAYRRPGQFSLSESQCSACNGLDILWGGGSSRYTSNR